MTLGTIVKICIQYYFEVFDEVPDRAEAVNTPAFQEDMGSPSTPSTLEGTSGGTPLASPTETKRFSTLSNESDIDDGMLVMPVGPSASSSSNAVSPESPPGVRRMAQLFSQGPFSQGPPSAWNSASASGSSSPTSQLPYTPRTPRSVASGGSPQARTASKAKARSLLSPSPSNGSANFLSHSPSSSSAFRSTPASRMGTLSKAALRKGATVKGVVPPLPSEGSYGAVAKAAGSGVSAVGVTAVGFFSPAVGGPEGPSST